MPPHNLALRLRVLGYSNRQAARLFGTSEQTVRRWRAGTVQVPGNLADWLIAAVPAPLVLWVESADQFAASNPPPIIGRK